MELLMYIDAMELLFVDSYVLLSKGIEGIDVFSHDSKKRNQLVCKPIHIEIQTCETTNSMPGMNGYHCFQMKEESIQASVVSCQSLDCLFVVYDVHAGVGRLCRFVPVRNHGWL